MAGGVAGNRAISDDSSPINCTTVSPKAPAGCTVSADRTVLDDQPVAGDRSAVSVKVIKPHRVVTADGTVLDQGATDDSATVAVARIVCDTALVNG